MNEVALRGRAALVTGVSGRQGIGFAIASRLVARRRPVSDTPQSP